MDLKIGQVWIETPKRWVWEIIKINHELSRVTVKNLIKKTTLNKRTWSKNYIKSVCKYIPAYNTPLYKTLNYSHQDSSND